MPSLFIITGSNGAGKSSIGRFFLPDDYQEHTIFDGDKLFLEKRSELWRQGIKANKEARNLAADHVEKTFDRLVDQAIAGNNDFLYEGHFTNDATWDVPLRFKRSGYDIHLIFLGLRNLELSEARVVERSKTGGHYVDPLTLSSNYYGNMEKLNLYYAMFDTVQVVDSSEPDSLPIVFLEKGKKVESISENELPLWFVEHLPAISRLNKEEIE